MEFIKNNRILFVLAIVALVSFVLEKLEIIHP